MEWHVLWIVFLLIIYLKDGGATGYCKFPAYLWEPLPDGTERKWISRTEYFRNTETWEQQKEISAKETEITIHHKVYATCSGYDVESAAPCFRQDIEYNIMCISEEREGRFRVQQENKGKYKFSCLQFVQRNPNIVQVYSAVPQDVNEDRLCHDGVLHREEWPWIVPQQNDWHFCPISGGFDFTAYESSSGEKMCETEWRPSRVESECILGEGVQFLFPRSDCSFFKKHTDQRLYCWGSWVESNYRFLILAEKGKMPRYVMRFLKDIPEETSVAHLYFGVVLPLSGRGNPPGRISAYELHITRSGTGVCYDESAQCSAFLQEGKCPPGGTHEYVNYCHASCGFCDLAPTQNPECHFPNSYVGNWTLFDERLRQDVNISSGRITSSVLGNFICKSKHWEMDYYKVLSSYDNGCRPRYSCVQLTPAGGILQLKLSHSELNDKSFSICQFRNDPEPLGNRVRSHSARNLLPTSNFEFGSCGLGGILHVNVTFDDHVSCDGSMRDIDLITCNSQPTVSLKFHDCEERNQEHECVGYAQLPTGTSFVVTRRKDSGDGHYICWVVKAQGLGYRDQPWRQSFQFHRAHCSTGVITSPNPQQTHITSISTYNDLIDKPCGRTNTRRPLIRLFPRPTTSHPTPAPARDSANQRGGGWTTPRSVRVREQSYREVKGRGVRGDADPSRGGCSFPYSHLGAALISVLATLTMLIFTGCDAT